MRQENLHGCKEKKNSGFSPIFVSLSFGSDWEENEEINSTGQNYVILTNEGTEENAPSSLRNDAVSIPTESALFSPFRNNVVPLKQNDHVSRLPQATFSLAQNDIVLNRNGVVP